MDAPNARGCRGHQRLIEIDMNLSEIDYLRGVAERRDAAPHGQKREVIALACHHLQISAAELHRRLAELGLNGERKRRSDAGRSTLSEDEARLICGVMTESTRANGKRLLTFEDAVDMLRANGKLECSLSAAHIARVMREKGWHPDQLTKASAHTQLASLHPNHVWQIDASICVLYYLDTGGLSVMDEKEFEKNKPANFARVADKRVIRYVITDHFSGSIWVSYFTGSENSENLTEAFLAAIQPKTAQEPLHGVPFIVNADAASANKGQLFQNLLKRLKCNFIAHLPGNARATGQVENAQNLIERHFEARLAFLRVTGLDHLNQLAQQWRIAFNAMRKHTRHGMTRYACWQRIKEDQLRLPPSIDLCRELVSTHPVEATVRGDLTITHSIKGFGSTAYSLRDCAGIEPKEKVLVVVNPYRAPAIDVTVRGADGQEVTYTIEPQAKREGGFAADAPVIGESFAAPRDSVTDTRTKQLLKDAYGTETLLEADAKRKAKAPAYAGQIDSFADVKQTQVPDWMGKRGTTLDVPEVAREIAPLTHTQAAIQLRHLLDRHLEQAEYAWLRSRFADGVPAEQIGALAQQFSGKASNVDQADGTHGPAGIRRIK